MRPWAGAHVTKAREYVKRVHGWTCWICGHAITDDDDYTVDHVKERKHYPELTWEPSNWRPAHKRKHPEFGCPGNSGRSANAQPRQTPVQAWTSPSW